MAKTEHVPGRAPQVEIAGPNGMLSLCAIHNHGLTRAQVLAVTKRMREDFAVAEAAPLTRTLWVCGDWNFRKTGESARALPSVAWSTTSHAAEALEPTRTQEAANTFSE